MKAIFDLGTIELVPSGRDYRAILGEWSAVVRVVHVQAGRLDLSINGKSITAFVSSDGAKRWVTVGGQTFLLIKSGGRRGRQAGHAPGELTAPMPGQVRAINVREGEQVSQGQTLMLLEAMKMEIRIQAPRDGTVKKLKVKQGQTVERDQLLAEIVEPGGS